MTVAPKLISMDRVRPLMTRQGQPMVPLVSADLDDTATTLLSAGVVHMRRGHVSRAHRHDDTDVIVLLWKAGKAGALTLYGERLEHEIRQQPHQALWIPRGIPHAAVNPSRFTSVVAWEFRSNPVLGEDNHPLPTLQPIVETRRTVVAQRRSLAALGREGRGKPNQTRRWLGDHE
jgi:uncharacterized RmlC-like cupin family protein